VVHRLVVEGEELLRLEEAFSRFSTLEGFEVEGTEIGLDFGKGLKFRVKLEKPLEDYYTDEVREEWKAMVAEALGTEEPFRYYSFYDEAGKHLGTVGYKRDCDTFLPVLLAYKNF